MSTVTRLFYSLLFALSALAQPSLKYAVIVSRHGVRSPTQTAEQLSQYTSDPWPDWGVPPGNLTPHGRVLMKQFGMYNRAYLAARGLLPADGCGAEKLVTFWADSAQRTLETARALAEGTLPGCNVEIGSKPVGERDPLFNPLGVLRADGGLAAAAVLGRIGGDPAALADLHHPDLEELARILGGSAGKQAWLHAPMTVSGGKEDGLADITGPLRTASTLSEVFLLEYANGMSGKDLAWGRLDLTGIRRLTRLHEAYAELARRTPYVARARGSNLLSHILNSLDQAASHKPVSGALGKPADAVLCVVGHDTNLSNLAGALSLSWLLPGYQPNDPVPGGALVFELWQEADAQLGVRVYYTAQSLEQMNGAVALSLSAPPLRAPVFVPGCSSAVHDFECKWEDFRRAALASIDPSFVPAASSTGH